MTEFPNFQVYQAHNSIMAGLRAPGADMLEFYLRARRTIEEIVAPSGLRPVACECYRPLWYFTFRGCETGHNFVFAARLASSDMRVSILCAR